MRCRIFDYSETVLLLLILALAAYLRLDNVTENPSWYTDEETNLDVAQHLARGQCAGVHDMISHVENWPLVFVSGTIRVYENNEF